MGTREPFSSKIDSDLKLELLKLSEATRIPQAKLIDEALEDLLKKYKVKRP